MKALISLVRQDVVDALELPVWKTSAMWRWFARADVFEPQERKFSHPEMMAVDAMLYDDTRGLLASASGTEPGTLAWTKTLQLVSSGRRRMAAIVTRYQR